MSHRTSLAMWLALATGALGCGSEGPASSMDASPDAEDDASMQTCLDVTSGPGGPCACDLDCPAGGICATEEEYGFPRGFCSVACSLEEEAPEGLECLAIPGFSVYFEACGEALSCRDGWMCSVHSETKIGTCSVRCSSDAHCLTGSCNLYTGYCEGATTGAGVGGACTLNQDCKSGMCFVDEDSGNWCLVSCNADDGICPEGAFCYPIGTEPGDTRGVCFDI
jgi:hypothetical protein